MIPREEEILNDPWARKNYCDAGRNYIEVAFEDGVSWADENPDKDTIRRILNVYKKIKNQDLSEDEIIDYVKEHFKDER